MGWLNDSETEQDVFKGYEAGYTSMHIDFAILATCITTNVCDFGFRRWTRRRNALQSCHT